MNRRKCIGLPTFIIDRPFPSYENVNTERVHGTWLDVFTKIKGIKKNDHSPW